MAVALVTGAAQGIGRAVAERLARDGLAVAVNDRVASDELRAVAQAVDGLETPADVADAAAVAAMFETVRVRLGPVRVLVTCAAAMDMAPFADYRARREAWWRQIDVNLGGTFVCAQRAAAQMRAAGGGRMVLFSSGWGVTGWPGATAYAASKAGVIALGKSLARELAPHGIGVNVVAPGPVDTPQLEVDARAAGVDRTEVARRYGAQVGLGRIGRPDEIAAVASFLASDRAAAFVGQVLTPDGGALVYTP